MTNQATLQEFKSPQIFDPFAGGRFSNAVRENEKLNSGEKLLMLNIIGELDFRDLANSSRYISKEKLSKWTGLSERHIVRITNQLVQNGYLIKEDRYADNGAQRSNIFRIGTKLYDEYAASKGVSLPAIGGDMASPGRVTSGHSNLPKKELPHKKTLISKDISVQKAPASGATTTESDMSICGDGPDALPIIDLFSEDKPKEEIKPKASNRKARPKKTTRPPVTSSHQKVFRVFDPDPRFVKNTWCDKNAIFFAVDELISTHGENAHRAIDAMYQHFRENDWCGKYKYNIALVESVLKDAIETYLADIQKQIDEIPF